MSERLFELQHGSLAVVRALCLNVCSAAIGDVHHYAAMVWTRPKAVLQLFFQSCHFIDGEWSREYGSTAC